MRPALTHVALGVRDAAASVTFYQFHAQLSIVHDRFDGTRVVWLSDHEDHPAFVLVLIEGAAKGTAFPSSLLHFGFAVASRDQVDEIAAQAREHGVLVSEPMWGGEVVGYFCMLRDPDGHWVEFSYGQTLGPPENER
jgi:catechol 2,3-dioxygenase-like lactoylglutathione lyase family enzyme